MAETPATKPHCTLIGTDGNVFMLLGHVSATLKKAGQPEQAQAMTQRIMTCESYEEALRIFMEYVTIV